MHSQNIEPGEIVSLFCESAFVATALPSLFTLPAAGVGCAKPGVPGLTVTTSQFSPALTALTLLELVLYLTISPVLYYESHRLIILNRGKANPSYYINHSNQNCEGEIVSFCC
jgi:hypothetical protein